MSVSTVRLATVVPLPLPLARLTAVCCLFGAEAIHTSVMDEHINEWLPIGLFFLAISLVEGLLAVALITVPTPKVSKLAIGVSLGTVALWLLTRTVGIPIGPMAWNAEPFGRADTLSSALELVTAVVLLGPVTALVITRKRALSYALAALIVAAATLVTIVGVTQSDAEESIDLTPDVITDAS